MSDVQSVTVIVSNPAGPDDLGRCTVGYYVIVGNLLTMTYGDGKPYRGRMGEPVTQRLERDDDPRMVAQRLTLRIHRSRAGDNPGFNRRLVYPPSGVA